VDANDYRLLSEPSGRPRGSFEIFGTYAVRNFLSGVTSTAGALRAALQLAANHSVETVTALWDQQ
jgi:hypothetical protein